MTGNLSVLDEVNLFLGPPRASQLLKYKVYADYISNVNSVFTPWSPTCLCYQTSTSSCHFLWRRRSIRWQPPQNQHHILTPHHTLFIIRISLNIQQLSAANV